MGGEWVKVRLLFRGLEVMRSKHISMKNMNIRKRSLHD